MRHQGRREARGERGHGPDLQRIAGRALILICGVVAAATLTGRVQAQDITRQDLQQLRQAILDQRHKLEAQSRLLAKQEERLRYLESQLERKQAATVQPAVYPVVPAGPAGGRRPRATASDGTAGQAGAVAQAEQTAPSSPGSTSREIVSGTVPERAGAGVFGRRGEFTLEPSFEYTHNQQNRVSIEGFTVIPAITVGNIDVREVKRDTVTAALTGRYNLTDRLQVDVKVPWVRRQDSTISRPLSTGASQDAEFTADGSGLGDIEAGAHYQFTDGLGALPILVANVRVKSRTGKDPFEVPLEPSGSDFAGLESELPTGNGFWAVEPSVTAIIPSDPVVFFATAGYQWNIKRTITSENVNSGASTEIDPGDAFKVGMGFGFGINERASFNLGYDHAFVFKSTQNGQDILNSDLQVGTFSTGVAYRLNKNMNMNVSLGIGVTDPAPDAQLMLRIPYKFGN